MFFFMGGVQQKEIELGAYDLLCPVCNKKESYLCMKSYHYFHIFFIPLFRFRTEYYGFGPCGTMIALEKDIGKALEDGTVSTILQQDYSIVTKGGRAHICSTCGHSQKEQFNYCPRCGEKNMKDGEHI